MIARRIDIALGFDAGYAPHAAAVIASIGRRTRTGLIRFIILYDGVDLATRRRVELAAPDAAFHWVEITNDDVPAFATRGHFSRAVLNRLGLEKRAPADCTRVLYIDVDVVVLGDVRELWEMDLEGSALGAVIDCEGEHDAFAARWGLPQSDLGYFNSGVLLLDLEQIRARKLFSATLEFFAEHHSDLTYVDQDALNAVFWNAWKPLDPAWNVQKLMALEAKAGVLPDALMFHNRAPKLVHFTGAEKPWRRDAYHPWAWLYWKALAQTAFKSDVTKRHDVTALDLARMRLRWLRRKPA
jgi:lipopolysaccharide biosynthesis glycosyltransferase